MAPHVEVYLLAERLQVVGLKKLLLGRASEIALQLSDEIWDITPYVPPPKKNDEMTKYISLVPGKIRLVYDNTPSQLENHQAAKTKNATAWAGNVLNTSEDGLRDLLAGFCASCLGEIKTCRSFEEAMRDIPDFAVDVIAKLEDKRLQRCDKGVTS